MHIVGKRIVIRAIERADLPLIRGWFNDPEVVSGLGDVKWPTSQEQQEHHFERTRHNESTVRMMVELKEDQTCIGLTGFWGIHLRDRRAEHAVVIGERECQGQGYGTEIIRTCAQYAFDQMDLHRLDADILANNAASLKAYQRVGFQVEGTLREHAFRDGKRIDRIMLGLLKNEFVQGAD